MEIYKNFILTEHNTFGIHIRSKYFTEIVSISDLKEVVKSKEFLNEAQMPAYSVLDCIGSWESISLERNYCRDELETIINELSNTGLNNLI